METLIATLLGVGLVGVGIALHYARSADQFADKCHGRMNGIMERFTRLEERRDLDRKVIDGIRFDLNALNEEVFGDGRSGVYPDMGLREWARVWRGRLREDVKVLHLRTDSLNRDLGNHLADQAFPTVSQEDIASLDKRIDTISELRHLDSEDLKVGKAAHNHLTHAVADLVDHLGLEYTDEGAFVKKPRARK